MEGPDIQALVDQAIAANREAARMIRAYFISLTDEGFTSEQAVELTIAFQATLIAFADRQ